MDKDGVTDALSGQGAEINPLQDQKGKECATKRFEINDLYKVVLYKVVFARALENEAARGPGGRCAERGAS